jgi:hypothetical protein
LFAVTLKKFGIKIMTMEKGLLKKDRPALILIDIQKGFENVEYWGGQRNNLNAEKMPANF